MSVRFTEGFDSYQNDYSQLPSTGLFRRVANTTIGFSCQMADSRWNDGSDINPGKGILLTTSPVPGTSIANSYGGLGFSLQDCWTNAFKVGIRFSFRTPPSSTLTAICSLVNSDGSQRWGLSISALGYLLVQDSFGGTIASAHRPIGTAVWVTLDLVLRTNTGQQVCIVKIDGEEVINISTGLVATQWTDFILGLAAISQFNIGTSANEKFDDLIIVVDDSVVNSQGDSQNDLPADLTRVETFYPTSIGASTIGFTGTGGTTVSSQLGQGSNDGDTTYYSSATVNDQLVVDSTGVLSINPTEIYWVASSFIGRKEGVGARACAPLIYDASTVYSGSAFVQGTTYGQYADVWMHRPSNGNAWTQSTVESLLWGQIITV